SLSMPDYFLTAWLYDLTFCPCLIADPARESRLSADIYARAIPRTVLFDTESQVRETRVRNSILLHCLELGRWWNQHPMKSSLPRTRRDLLGRQLDWSPDLHKYSRYFERHLGVVERLYEHVSSSW